MAARNSRPARRYLEWALYRAGTGILSLLPEDRAADFGRLVARLYFRYGHSRRSILYENLRRSFPEKTEEEIDAIARRCTGHFGAVLMDFLALSRLPLEQIRARVRVEGEENLQRARARGKGVFLLSAHLGNWEVGALVAGTLGEPISSVVRPLDNPRLEQELARHRTHFGNRTIPKQDAARPVLRAMRRGETVAILIDQNVLDREAVYVPFFGRPAATTPSLALLQRKTDAAVVPVFCRPTGNGHYRLTFEAPIVLEDIPEPERSAEQLTARYTRVTEDAVREDPALWLWMHNRWRTRQEQAAASADAQRGAAKP
jgi:Kdo2-lipid IVA lauroyltransferase/acyltransferase